MLTVYNINQEEYLMLKQNMTEKIETLDKMIESLTETAKLFMYFK